MTTHGKVIERKNSQAESDGASDLSSNATGRNQYTIFSADRFMVQTWLFRFTLAGIAFLAVLFCHWLFNSTSSGLVEALLAVVGLLIGFGMSGARSLLP